jgi:hypothetical protein
MNDNDAYEPPLPDADLVDVDWRSLVAGAVLGLGVAGGLLLLWLERD